MFVFIYSVVQKLKIITKVNCKTRITISLWEFINLSHLFYKF